MNHGIVYKEANRYCSFPHLVRLQSGEIGLVFRKASQFSSDSAKRGMATHHDPDSSIEMVTSADEGKTWRQPQTVYKSKYGVNDPSLTVLKNGDLLLRLVALNVIATKEVREITQPIFSHRVEHGLVTTVVGNLVLRSSDNGKSWKEIGIANTSTVSHSCSRDPIVEMPDGSWLMPIYTGAPQRSDISWVIRSFDEGKTWVEPTPIALDPKGEHSQLHGINYNETSILHLGRGECVALIRGDESFHTDGDSFMPVGGCGELYSTHSFDGGLCWEPVRKTGIWGQPGSMIQLSDGRLLATYGYRRKPFGVRAALSQNRGRSWSHDKEIILREDSPTWDVGYPFTIELGSGKMLTVYYCVDEEGTRHVASTHWGL